MHLYDCRLDTFIPYATTGQIADILRQRFVDRLEQNPSDSEVKSWRNSLGAFAEAVTARDMDEAWIVMEYQLPLASSRIDCMVLGTDASAIENSILIELKQWDACRVSRIPEVVDIGGQSMLHPSAQVRNYRRYLEDAHSAFADDGVRLASCAFLHNLKRSHDSSLMHPQYADILDDSPLFGADAIDGLARFVSEPTHGGAPDALVESVLGGRYKPSRKLLDHVADSIEGYEPWKLLDEQQIVFSEVMADIEDARARGDKHVVIVTGGPGTGKSVIALQVLGAAARKGYNVVHATGSKAFTTNLRGIVESNAMFRYFNSFTKEPPNSIDLMVADEAHRLRETSNSRWRKTSDRPQVAELVDTSKVSLFLLDHAQNVRPNEIGSVELIANYAASRGTSVSIYDLSTQFRCAGSESYIRWVDYVLGLNPNRSMAWKRECEYEVKVFNDVRDMETALMSKIARGNSARMVAGFVWPWSDPNEDGTLVKDVVIGDWARSWNRKPREMWRHRRGSAERPSTHPYTLWATEPSGFGEVGCIYSAQGFEFDYVGVIFCDDLRWDPLSAKWVADLPTNKDAGFKRGLGKNPQMAAERLKHIYRVLSTRGMKGTYFYFLDEATARRFERLGADAGT